MSESYIRRGIVVASALLSLVLIISAVPVARASTHVLLNTVAEWDAGTSNDPGDGNWGIETNTDNPAIPENSFQVGSMSGDGFTYADVDADTWKWTTVDGGGGGENPSIGTVGADTVLRHDIGALGTWIRTDAEAQLDSTAEIDIQVQINDATIPNVDTDDIFFRIYDSVTGDGMRIVLDYDGIVDYTLRADLGDANVWVTQDTYTFNAFPIWIRMIKDGNTHTWQRSADNVLWVNIDQTVQADITGSFRPAFYTELIGGAYYVYWDFYEVNEGTFLAAYCRMAGTWTSALFAEAPIIYTEITYTGATALAYIDEIEFLQAGVPLYTYDLDVTSGTLLKLYPLVLTTQVRITLADDGNCALQIQSIELFTFGAGGTGDVLPPTPLTNGWNNGYNGFDIDFPDIISCYEVVITDVRPQAENSILYIWDFGDGETTTTTEGNITHTYDEGKMYNMTMRVQDKYGKVLYYYFNIETGIACSLGKFLDRIILSIIATLVLIAAAILVFFGKRISERTKKLLRRIILYGGVIIVISIFLFGIIPFVWLLG